MKHETVMTSGKTCSEESVLNKIIPRLVFLSEMIERETKLMQDLLDEEISIAELASDDGDESKDWRQHRLHSLDLLRRLDDVVYSTHYLKESTIGVAIEQKKQVSS